MSKQPTIEDLKKYQDELSAKFGRSASIAYVDVSRTQLSIARHYGGCTVVGKNFLYNAADDSLIREDVVKWVVKRKKEDERNERKLQHNKSHESVDAGSRLPFDETSEADD